MPDRTKIDLENYFDRKKKNYCPPDDDNVDFEDDNLIFVPLPGVADSPKRSIFRGRLRLTNKEFESVFAPTFEQINDLIIEQMVAAQERIKRENTVLPLLVTVSTDIDCSEHVGSVTRRRFWGIQISEKGFV